MPNIKQFHPSARINPQGVGVKTIPLTLTSDVDLTDPEGQTGGYCARALLVGDTAGNIKFDSVAEGDAETQAVAANSRLEQAVSKVYSTGNGTTAATVSAVL